jgi:carboxylesterase type B
MDFATGAALFAKYCKNKTFVRAVTMNPKNASKLEYELKKLAGIPLTLLFTQKCSNKELLKNIDTKKIDKKSQTFKAVQVPKVLITQTTKHTPNDPIAKAKKLIKDWYIQIDKMHKELYDLGESNDPAVVKQRKTILEKRKPIIKKYDELYLLKEDFFKTGIIAPRIEELIKTK